MSKYKSLDEIIDAFKGRPEPMPETIVRDDGQWWLTPSHTYIWVPKGTEQAAMAKYGQPLKTISTPNDDDKENL